MIRCPRSCVCLRNELERDHITAEGNAPMYKKFAIFAVALLLSLLSAAAYAGGGCGSCG